MSLILLYGDYATDFDMVGNFFHNYISYKIIKLYEL